MPREFASLVVKFCNDFSPHSALIAQINMAIPGMPPDEAEQVMGACLQWVSETSIDTQLMVSIMSHNTKMLSLAMLELAKNVAIPFQLTSGSLRIGAASSAVTANFTEGMTALLRIIHQNWPELIGIAQRRRGLPPDVYLPTTCVIASLLFAFALHIADDDSFSADLVPLRLTCEHIVSRNEILAPVDQSIVSQLYAALILLD